ncbi:hypothetical protein [Hydrogenophaga sp.]|uniref:hypothetical protein n=1 Tax=Hydrogenophaga sp. TaxID=1904254 RepID=UPI0035B20D9D
MSAQPEALRIAYECEQSAKEWLQEVETRKQAAAELRRLHAENEANERNLCQLTDELAKTVALLRQAQEALETDDWQKKLQAAIDIKHHLENGS